MLFDVVWRKHSSLILRFTRSGSSDIAEGDSPGVLTVTILHQ